MRVFHGFDNLPAFRSPVVTVGSYDGVHAGHRALLGKINRLAAEQGGESVVITFSPHPRIVLGQGDGLRLLSTLKEKILLFASAGVDNLIVAPFTEAFSHVSSDDFVRDFLVGKVGLATLVAGYNHHFGYKKAGDFHALTRLQEQLSFGIYIVPRRDVDRDKVSSTAIRGLVARGDMERAARALAHPYFLIVHREAGDCTVFTQPAPAGAAFRIVSDEAAKLLPPAGVYRVTVAVVPEASGVPETSGNTAAHAERWTDVLTVAADGSLYLPSAERLRAGADVTVTFD